MTAPDSSCSGMRETTTWREPMAKTSSSSARPLSMTWRRRLFGMTSSTMRPSTGSAPFQPSSALYLSLIQVMRPARSTTTAPS